MQNNKDIKDIGWNFNNSYLELPEFFYRKIDLSPVDFPELVIINEELAAELGLDSSLLKSEAGILILAGNHKAQDGAYIAQAYAGHQFGYFTMLGDGRAMLIGEQITSGKDRYDIQLKGSGITDFSRGGDGRAALGPMLREYIISEAMHGLGIPTTRSLAVVLTGEKVYRQREEKGAILTRISSSHIRVGTFEYAASFGDKDKIRALADYAIRRHYPKVNDEENKYLGLLSKVVDKQAKLVAMWQSVGFIHGVMNTDNMSISGETIDYGPCAFMDSYNPDTVFSSIDAEGRYSYKNQPKMAHWNLCRLAEALLPVIDENEDKAMEQAKEIVNSFLIKYQSYWLEIMRRKLGIMNDDDSDVDIIDNLLNIMEKYKADYTNTFLSLTFGKDMDSEMFRSKEFDLWYKAWNLRISNQQRPKEKVQELMKSCNPAVIPRNHRVEEALEAADNGDYSVMTKLVDALAKPYAHSDEQSEYSKLPKPSSCPYKTYCGT